MLCHIILLQHRKACYAPWSLAARHTVIDCLVVTAPLHSHTCLTNSGFNHYQTWDPIHLHRTRGYRLMALTSALPIPPPSPARPGSSFLRRLSRLLCLAAALQYAPPPFRFPSHSPAGQSCQTLTCSSTQVVSAISSSLLCLHHSFD